VLAERCFPAFDIERSGTRAEEKLPMPKHWQVSPPRRMIDAMVADKKPFCPLSSA
jgi:transcription termination factor Rho